jgi:hypothetical protein
MALGLQVSTHQTTVSRAQTYTGNPDVRSAKYTPTSTITSRSGAGVAPGSRSFSPSATGVALYSHPEATPQDTAQCPSSNCALNITSSSSSAHVALSTNVVGSGCASSSSCSNYNGLFSFQFNIVFPTDVGPNWQYGFMLQDVTEANLTSGQCKAQAQGAPSAPPAPSTTPYYFPCSQATLSGGNFEWNITPATGYFENTGFLLNGQMVSSFASATIFLRPTSFISLRFSVVLS